MVLVGNRECNTERGFKNQLYIKLGLEPLNRKKPSDFHLESLQNFIGIYLCCYEKFVCILHQNSQYFWNMGFCDRFSGHRGYVSQKKYDQVCGEHFNKPGHSQLDMLPVILEEVTPKNDDFLRLRREELWIRRYQSIEFGANKHSWNFL